MKYGGLSKDGELENTDAVTEIIVRPAAKHTVEFSVTEVGFPLLFCRSKLVYENPKNAQHGNGESLIGFLSSQYYLINSLFAYFSYFMPQIVLA